MMAHDNTSNDLTYPEQSWDLDHPSDIVALEFIIHHPCCKFPPLCFGFSING